MMLSSNERKKIKKEIPWGMQSEIAKELGISRQVVSNVLSGVATSKRVDEAIIRHYLAYKKKVRRISKMINDGE
ncbi:hypothetical protein [Bacteroides sp. BFG-606]|uniref:hypothetical protein n=1 Tax=Bacteroides sp. BFG-606 TaxID=2972763 RepID=UPI0021655C80|nr:hypothetical protein [Bacteroides sp. BFG-606]MCS2335393.1 hypothetical protein [Bacteroides sp. BFG-606]